MENLYVREIHVKFKRTKTKTIKASSPNAVWEFYRKRIGSDVKESFHVLGVDNKNMILFTALISVGTITESVVHPREVFFPAIQHLCSGVIAVHNHPSGNPSPSKQDIETTKRLFEAGKIVGIPLMDHIIITDSSYYSMKENGYM